MTALVGFWITSRLTLFNNIFNWIQSSWKEQQIHLEPCKQIWHIQPLFKCLWTQNNNCDNECGWSGMEAWKDNILIGDPMKMNLHWQSNIKNWAAQIDWAPHLGYNLLGAHQQCLDLLVTALLQWSLRCPLPWLEVLCFWFLVNVISHKQFDRFSSSLAQIPRPEDGQIKFLCSRIKDQSHVTHFSHSCKIDLLFLTNCKTKVYQDNDDEFITFMSQGSQVSSTVTL